MGEGTDQGAGELKAQILDFLDRWPSRYPSPGQDSRSHRAVAQGGDRRDGPDQGQWGLAGAAEQFPAPPPRPADEPRTAVGHQDQSSVAPPVLPAWDRSSKPSVSAQPAGLQPAGPYLSELLFELVDLVPEAGRKFVAEGGEVLTDARHLGSPLLRIDGQQLVHVGGGDVQTVGVDELRGRA